MGYGPVANGKQKPITPWKGSWAEQQQRNRLQTGDQGEFLIRGHWELCRITACHPFGTYDVERLLDGSCFRVTGLPL